MALRPCDEGRHGLVEDVVAEDEAEGVRTRPPLVLEEFDGGAVVSKAYSDIYRRPYRRRSRLRASVGPASNTRDVS